MINALRPGYALVFRIPAVAHYQRLRSETRMSPFDPAAAAMGLANSFLAVAIKHDGVAIGMTPWIWPQSSSA